MRIDWQCLGCGDHGIKTVGYDSMKDPRVTPSVLSQHNVRNPGCRGGEDAIRVREDTDDDRDARLRAG